MEADGWIYVSVPLGSGMVHWPDNPPVRFTRHGVPPDMIETGFVEVRERREGRIGSFLREYAEAPRS